MIKHISTHVMEKVEAFGYEAKVVGETDICEDRGAHTQTMLCMCETNCGKLFEYKLTADGQMHVLAVSGVIERQLLADVFETAAKVLRELDREHDAEHNKFMEDKKND